MDLHTYQPLARRTLKELPTYYEHMGHMALGINGELGEIADAIKKHFIYGKPLDRVNLVEEGGDGWRYIVGMVPELTRNVDGGAPQGLVFLQAGYDSGLVASSGVKDPVRLITQIEAQVASATLSLLTPDAPSSSYAAQTLMVLGRNMGLYYGHFNLDLAESLELNIAKLAKRYGDKYSDFAALNRDTGAERQVLEGSAKVIGMGTTPPKSK